MDCQEIQELLDAYALGAATKQEAEAIERHVVDCVRCWEQLSEAQRAAAALALTVDIEPAPAPLRQRVFATAERGLSRGRARAAIRRGFGRRWPAAAGALAAAAVAALVFAAVLQVEMNDLRDENDDLAQRAANLDSLVAEQRQLMAVLTAPDSKELVMHATSPEAEAVGVYYWSRQTGKGFLVSNNLPDLGEDRVYQVWVVVDETPISAGTFESWEGIGQKAMDLATIEGRPDGIGVTIEAAGGSDQPTDEMVLFAPMAR